MTSKDNAGVLEAIKVAGSQSKLAELLGIDQPLIAYYLKTQVPAKRAIQIEEVTGVSKKKIRPDLWS